MAEYIEREAFRKKLAIGAEYLDGDTLMTVVNLLDCEPAADVAPVVRCKDCKHRDPENHHCDHPAGTMIYFPRRPDDFCSYGERKDGAG